VDIDSVRSVLTAAGYGVAGISAVGEGSNHYVFLVSLSDGREAVCKFARTRETERGLTAGHTDTLFGGRLSLDRETYLLSLARNEGGLPVPEVYGVRDSPLGRYILLERSPGVPFTAWLRVSGYRLQPYLESLRALGRDFGRLHSRIRPASFGDMIGPGAVEPGCANFADRFLPVVEMRIGRGVKKGTFSAGEADGLRRFFTARFEKLRPFLSAESAPPVMVFTDMHGNNYFVDENGVPTGYFDLESSQAAPAALEFYGFQFFLFNFFGAAEFEKAQAAFLDGYTGAGGPFAPAGGADEELIDLLAGCRLLELAESYWKVDDRIRSTWGERMKALLHKYTATGEVDYCALGAIWRERDGGPAVPSCG